MIRKLYKTFGIITACLCLTILAVIPNRTKSLSSQLPKPTEVQEITYERVFGCEERCPVFKVVLRKDGTASYEGTRYADRKGKYHATGVDYYFVRLKKLLETSRFTDLQDAYGPHGKDEGFVITSMADNEKRKTVTNYGSDGPIELWAIEMAVEGSVYQIKWEKDH